MDPSATYSSTFVATLGGQPQVVTFTLDLLLAHGHTVNEVLVLWLPGHERYRAAMVRLRDAFVGDVYQGRPIHFRSVPLRLGERPLADLQHPAELDAAWKQVDALLERLKGEERHLHLSLTGGRRMLALLTLSAAMRHLTPSDKVWHIYTPEAIREAARDGRLLHADLAQLRLIEVPFFPLGSYLPAVRELLGRSPRTLPPALDEDTRQRCERAWAQFTPREQEVLRALVAASNRREAAEALHISLSTLDTHKNHILQTCRALWQDERVDIHFLRRVFGAFLNQV